MAVLRWAAPALPAEAVALRTEVRSFLAEARARGLYRPVCDSWMRAADPGFSALLGDRGWVGMTIPTAYGGGGRSAIERFVVLEELLAAGAPVAAHWIADRQTAPGILRNGTETQKRDYLPRIARGVCYFCIGMSEPDVGSDLASVRTRATKTDGGWEITGSKIWTTGAHFAHAMVLLARTDPGERHEGLSQFLVDLPHPGIHIRPILAIDGSHHFNEVVFDGAVVSDEALLGKRGEGWRQVTEELAHERSGPERLLSTFPLLDAWRGDIDPADEGGIAELGRLVARAWTYRQMSASVAVALTRGDSPETEAAAVKDLGSVFERDLVEAVRRGPSTSGQGVRTMLADVVPDTPTFTLRGGTNQILRSVIARGLGLR